MMMTLVCLVIPHLVPLHSTFPRAMQQMLAEYLKIVNETFLPISENSHSIILKISP